MAGILLDTNVVSELRRAKPYKGVVNWLATVAEEDLFVSAVTLGEIQAGIEATRRRDPLKAKEIESWLDTLGATYKVIAMSGEMFREVARLLHGKSRAAYEDAMLAATAKVQGLTVATRNVADFKEFGVPLFNPFEFKS
jgi:predicted nucleic acid-binding protein